VRRKLRVDHGFHVSAEPRDGTAGQGNPHDDDANDPAELATAAQPMRIATNINGIKETASFTQPSFPQLTRKVWSRMMNRDGG
jgi:hypothetical protein